MPNEPVKRYDFSGFDLEQTEAADGDFVEHAAFDCLARELATAVQQRDANAADAARYRKVRRLYWFAREVSWRFNAPDMKTLEDLDAAVDAVRGRP